MENEFSHHLQTERFDSDILRRTGPRVLQLSGIHVNITLEEENSRKMYKQFIVGTLSPPPHRHMINRWENVQTLRRRIAFKIDSVFRESLTCWVYITEFIVAAECFTIRDCPFVASNTVPIYIYTTKKEKWQINAGTGKNPRVHWNTCRCERSERNNIFTN